MEGVNVKCFLHAYAKEKVEVVLLRGLALGFEKSMGWGRDVGYGYSI
jgi:hypothetical protein